jgi:hypothetical protein
LVFRLGVYPPTGLMELRWSVGNFYGFAG